MQVNQNVSPFISLVFAFSTTSLSCTGLAHAFLSGVLEQWSDENFESFWNIDKLQYSETPLLQYCKHAWVANDGPYHKNCL